MNTIAIIICGATFIAVGVTVVLLFVARGAVEKAAETAREDILRGAEAGFERMRGDLERRIVDLRNETATMSADFRNEIARNALDLRTEIAQNLTDFRTETGGRLTEIRREIGQKLTDQSTQNEQKLENIRNTMETRIRSMQDDNARQLDRMRETVDEKLQKTLEDRIGQSFKVVGERLEQVYKGLGEMQTLASGVGDLKKVLSNVKTRGMLGEIQLGAILEEILPREQYAENISTKRGSADRVEFAIRLPGDGDEPVYLPIDAKFPGDAYARLTDAYDAGNAEEIDAAGKQLEKAIRLAAKTIRDKYVQPPETTDFAILFLPFEGLYAEVLRRGLLEELQREYRINIAGPTTMAALLNSLQMGFKTLAIQERSSEVWNVLGAVKTEFGKFEDVLNSAQKRINQANLDLDKLIGTRTRAIRRKLRDVSGLSGGESLLSDAGVEDAQSPYLVSDAEGGEDDFGETDG
ncbi:MAG: DNA recombination protein RmuC [Clostridiales Family XIII bacterium]|jgi:DNA recombination protein RmuC|nr:DNA recombination protein RmuC [Clostridiales Family XIII bacterium]